MTNETKALIGLSTTPEVQPMVRNLSSIRVGIEQMSNTNEKALLDQAILTEETDATAITQMGISSSPLETTQQALENPIHMPLKAKYLEQKHYGMNAEFRKINLQRQGARGVRYADIIE